VTNWTDPRTWLAGEKLTAALLNQHLRDQLRVPSEAWPSYVPTWTAAGFAIGNGTIVGRRILAGKLCIGEIIATIGSTTTVGASAYIFGLPATALSSNMPIGNMAILDSSVPTVRQRNVYANSTTTCAANDEAGVFVSGAAPLALAVNDTIKIFFMYQVA
jgi:hypothetical protein